MSFYNPYSKYPDFAGGIQDFVQMLMQYKMLENMYPGEKKDDKGLSYEVPAEPPMGSNPAAQYYPPGGQAVAPQDDNMQKMIMYLRKIGII